MAMLQSLLATTDEDVVILEVYSLNRLQPRPLGVVVTFGSHWRCQLWLGGCRSPNRPLGPTSQAAHHGRTRSRGPCQWQKERRGGRSWSYLLVPLHTFQPGSKVDNMVRQLGRFRVDHHHYYHCQLRCHGARQQTACRRQVRIVAQNGKPHF